MKSVIAASALLAAQAAAFPAVMENAAREAVPTESRYQMHKRVNGISPGFDAKAQYISTTGQYAWVAPGPSDQRGPCPGLNAFANHGYIPHNGIASIQQFIDATTKVVGMGEDLAGFLSIYGAVFDGDLLSWSIGGPDARVGIIGLNQPQGISGSHNKYEADVSPTRGDLYQYGNDYQVVVDQFKAEYETQASATEETSNYDIGVLNGFRTMRFQQSVNNNPYFFNNFFSGVLVQPAAYYFQFRFMANHSAEQPEGRLSQENLKSWFGITGDYPNFQHTHGYERIPDNWYRRAFGDEYTIPYFLEDAVAAGLSYPQFLDIGGNTGSVNTFTGIDLLNVTGGLYNTAGLADPDKLACFEYQMLSQQAPDLLEGYANALQGALTSLQSGLNLLVANLSCPGLNSQNLNQYNEAIQQFPGATKLSSTGTY